jgi:hypothetical protein
MEFLSAIVLVLFFLGAMVMPQDPSTTNVMAARQALEQRIQQDASTSSLTFLTNSSLDLRWRSSSLDSVLSVQENVKCGQLGLAPMNQSAF